MSANPTLTYAISLLDKCPIHKGEGAAAALERVTGLVQLSERLGYRRYWFAEHHGAPGLASSAPEILIAHMLAKTSRIRVGAGGIMLQHYSTYKVAETFNTLASLSPGRVDLGIGKSPGGFPLSTAALQSGRDHAHWPNFEQQLQSLDKFIHAKFERGVTGIAVPAPLPPEMPERYVLGGSVESAGMAAAAGWNFVFAAHINSAPEVIEKSFIEYEKCGGRGRPLLALLVLATESEERAKAAVDNIRTIRVTFPDGHTVNLMNHDQAVEYARQAGHANFEAKEIRPGILAGTLEYIRSELDAYHRRFAVEEFIIETPMVPAEDKRHSIELMGNAFLSNGAQQTVAQS